MDRLTEEQITQKAANAALSALSKDVLATNNPKVGSALHQSARAAIIATLTEYAPHLLPRDADEELAERLAAEWSSGPGVYKKVDALALYVIKHMRESGK